MTDESGQYGPEGSSGQDPWAPPGDDPLHKRLDAVAQQPTVTSIPGAPGPAPGAQPPVGPPPTAPGGPQQPSAYGWPAAAPSSPYGQGAYPAQPGYGQGGYAKAGYPTGGYGYPAGAGWGAQPLPQGSAVASMVLGIIGLVLTATCWGSFLGVFVAPVALILGVGARRKADRGEQGGRSYATSGFIMGIVGTVLSVIILGFLIYVLANAEEFSDTPSDPYSTDARIGFTAGTV